MEENPQLMIQRPNASLDRLRIAMLSIHSSPVGVLGTHQTGGMSVYIRELAGQLGAAGHQVDIFTCDAGPTKATQIPLEPGVVLHQLNGNHGARPSVMQLHKRLPELVKRITDGSGGPDDGYDLVHSHYWISGVLGNLLQATWKVPHVTMFHTLGAVKNVLHGSALEHPTRIESERWLARCCHAMVAPTQRERDNLIHHYQADPRKIEVVPCGVNLERFRPRQRQQARRQLALKADTYVVLYVGRLARLKGIHRLLEAVARLKQLPLQLLIVGGDGPAAPDILHLKRLANRLGITPRVRFVGSIPQAELPTFYSAADLLVVPSRYESFGMVVLEALACGTPVLATPVGAAELLLQSPAHGEVVHTLGSDALAAGIRRRMALAHQEQPVAANVRQTVQAFDWHQVTRQILDVYARLLGFPAQRVPAQQLVENRTIN